MKISTLKIGSLIPALALMALVVLPSPALADLSASPDPAPLLAPVQGPADPALARVLELTNAQRVGAGMLPLRWSPTLAEAARAHAADMASRGYFAHNSPEGGTPTDRAAAAGYGAYGWGGHYVGENLARGYASSEEAFRGWMGSPGHRANVLNEKYREMGAALVSAPDGTAYWAQEFGSRPGELGLFIDADAPLAKGEAVELSIGREEVSDWGSLGEPVRMMLSNRADFAGAAWEPYSPRRGWRLQGAGAVGVYVLLEDGEGRAAQAADGIVLAQPALAQAEALHEGMAAEVPSALGETDEPTGDESAARG